MFFSHVRTKAYPMACVMARRSTRRMAGNCNMLSMSPPIQIAHVLSNNTFGNLRHPALRRQHAHGFGGHLDALSKIEVRATCEQVWRRVSQKK
jgi:hypothetical protein